jgi:hypothetical protein
MLVASGAQFAGELIACAGYGARQAFKVPRSADLDAEITAVD